jgi:hypothetical protein
VVPTVPTPTTAVDELALPQALNAQMSKNRMSLALRVMKLRRASTSNRSSLRQNQSYPARCFRAPITPPHIPQGARMFEPGLNECA